MVAMKKKGTKIPRRKKKDSFTPATEYHLKMQDTKTIYIFPNDRNVPTLSISLSSLHRAKLKTVSDIIEYIKEETRKFYKESGQIFFLIEADTASQLIDQLIAVSQHNILDY